MKDRDNWQATVLWSRLSAQRVVPAHFLFDTTAGSALQSLPY
ncbi:MAG: hypothetical protein ABR908_15070 [Terriglobales bacterium]|jgi:hypothetical protein